MDKTFSAKTIARFLNSIWIQLFLSILLLLFSIIAYAFLKNTILKNIHETGDDLAYFYSAQTQIKIKQFSELLNGYASEILRIENDGQITDKQQKIEDLLHLFNRTHSSAIAPYIFYDGKIYFSDTGKRDIPLDKEQIAHFQNSLNEENMILYSKSHLSDVTSQPVVTIAKFLPQLNTIIAIDVFIWNFAPKDKKMSMPYGSRYYLADRRGNIIFSSKAVTLDEKQSNEFVRKIVSSIHSSQLHWDKNEITNPNGQKRSVHYSVTENGWYSIVSIPRNVLLQPIYSGFLLVLLILILFIGYTAYNVIKEYRLFTQLQKIGKNIRLMSSRYIAIYKINYRTAQYECIKAFEGADKTIPASGDFSLLQEMIAEHSEQTKQEKIRQFFSLKNITQLIGQNIDDFGRDIKLQRNGSALWATVRCLTDLTRDEGDAIICIINIDKQKQQEIRSSELLKNALKYAQKSQQAKNRFFSGISHEMRTPLNIIIGLAELAENNPHDKESVFDYLKKIKISSNQLLCLVNDILTISETEESTAYIKSEPFDLKTCLKDCCSVYFGKAQNENKQFSLDMDIADQKVKSDSEKLIQIVNNILSNAFKYTKENGSVSLTVSQLSSDSEKKIGHYRFVFKDNGIGMNEESVKNIFDPHSAQNGQTSDSESLTGLGMKIVQTILKQLGGTMNIESKTDLGTTVTISLPLALMETAAQEKKEAPKTSADCQGKNFLIADDNAINIHILKSLLEQKKINVTTAVNGKEALEKFENAEDGFFDMILLDLQMPVMNGFQTARSIRSSAKKNGLSVPIIAVSANAFTEDKIQSKNCGINDHIAKPINIKELWDIIAKNLS